MVTREWNNMVIIVCLGWVGSGRKRNERRREKRRIGREGVCVQEEVDGVRRARRRKAI